MSTKPFNVIGLIGKHRDTEAIETLKSLKTHLQSKDLQLLLEDKTSEAVPGQELETASLNELGQRCDLVIVVGGDGNMLTAARALCDYDVPVVGINRGNLGFLTDINPHNLQDDIDEVLRGRYIVEERFLLECQLVRKGEGVINENNALNDIVISQAGMGKMMEFEVYIDEQFLYSQRSDGLITSTPTGSTAYALSASGPILSPELDAIALVPMCPHTLSSRPIVLQGDKEIKIVISHNNEIYPKLSCDGQVHFSTAPGDTILIRKQKNRLNLIHPNHICYYQTLRNKLQWGKRL